MLRCHPLSAIRGLVNEALVALEQEFGALYAPDRAAVNPTGEAVASDALASLLLNSICSERQLMVRPEFDLLFRWFVGVGVDDAAWDHSVCSKNRERLLEGDIEPSC
jgi:transposase